MPVPPPNSKSSRDPALDGLRGVAILLVYLFHYGGGLRSGNPAVRAFGYLTQAGWIGVELFFTLSGFLITRLLWDDLHRPHALRNFYARRALRILPLYFSSLALAALTALLAGSRLAALRPLLLYAGFLQNLPKLVPIALQYPPPLPLHHLWSLAVEEQFYLLWPFLLLAVGTRRRALHLCLGIFATSCWFRVLVWGPHPMLSTAGADWSAFFLSRAGALALGSALAFTSSQTSAKAQRWSLLGCLSGAVTFAAVSFTNRSYLLENARAFLLGLPAVEIAGVALLALTLAPGPWRRMLNLRPLGFLGRISYGFYIFHILFEPLFDEIGHWATGTRSGSAYQLIRLLTAFPLTLFAAWLSYTYVESPILQRKRCSRAEPWRPNPPQAPAAAKTANTGAAKHTR